MSKNLKKELENLVQIIEHHPDGISIEEMLRLMVDAIPRRTVQYRLSILVTSGVIRNEGAGRNSKYYINTVLESKPLLELESIEAPQITFSIPLSSEGRELRKLIKICQ